MPLDLGLDWIFFLGIVFGYWIYYVWPGFGFYLCRKIYTMLVSCHTVEELFVRIGPFKYESVMHYFTLRLAGTPEVESYKGFRLARKL